MTSTQPRTILLTGASGALGTELAARFSREGDRVLALVHEKTELFRAGRVAVPRWTRAGGSVTVIPGDVTQPGLGLTTEVRKGLCDTVDLVVHAAAVTDFGKPEQTYYAVNVSGTSSVLDLVSDLDVPVVYVSTAYVAGRRQGLVLEGDLDRGQSFSNDYERSKFEAECLFQLGVDAGLRGTVVRPSIVVGRRRDGVTRDFKNIYVMLRLVTSGRITRVPGLPDATLDLVPVDDVVDVVAAASRGLAGWTGKVLHAVGGPVTLADISRTVAEYPSLALPEYVPPANFSPSSLPSVQRALYERYVRLYEPYLTSRTRFDDSNAQQSCPHPRLSAGTLLRRLLNHSMAVGYLGPRRRTLTSEATA